MKNSSFALASFLFAILIFAGCNSLSQSNTMPSTLINTPIPPTPESPVAGSDGLGDLYFPGFGNGGYDVLHYLIDLEVDMVSNNISGRTVIDIETLQELTSLNFDFLGLDISEIKVNESHATYSRDGSELSIQLPEPLNENQFVQIEISYSGIPGAGIDFTDMSAYELGWVHYGYGVYVAGEPSGSSTWYPVNEHPSDKALYTFEITVDETYDVAANGTLQEIISDGNNNRHIWKTQYPQSNYLTTIAIAEFDLVEEQGPNGILIRNYFGEGVSNSTRRNFSVTSDILATFSDLFGPYPFEVYGAVVHDLSLNFALETQTLTVYGNSFNNFRVISHEIAHEWFGNSVTLSAWQDIWLNEGFASYASILWGEKSQGIDFTNGTIASFYESMSEGEPFRKVSNQAFAENYLSLLAQEKIFSHEELKAALSFIASTVLDKDGLDGYLESIPMEGLDAEGIGNLIQDLEVDEFELPSSSLAGFFSALGQEDLARTYYEEYPASGDPTADKLFNQTVYLRGAIVLHALRLKIGDEAFFNVLRGYYEQYEYGNANSENFISVAEDISRQELQPFFDAWLYSAKMPDIPELGLINNDYELSNIIID